MEEQVWAIAKWQETFENSSSRKLKNLNWVSMPVSFTSNGYNLMLDEFGEEAPAIYGAWCALVSVAANCTERGVLATTAGKPMRVSHIARVTGFPESVFVRLIGWASSDSVKWLLPRTCDTSGESADEVGDDRQMIGRSSGESPEHPTPPDLTRPNQTPPNPTDHTGSDNRGVGGGVDLVWDVEVAKRGAERLRRRFSKDVLPTGVCLQVALASSALEPDFISLLLADCQGKQIGSPRHYVLKAATNMASRHGWDWNQLVAKMPQPSKERPYER